jgi:hypothetical protein
MHWVKWSYCLDHLDVLLGLFYDVDGFFGVSEEWRRNLESTCTGHGSNNKPSPVQTLSVLLRVSVLPGAVVRRTGSDRII